MPYPRLLKLDDDTKAALRTFINDAITNHRAERGAFDEELQWQQEDYWASPPKEDTDFPFRGAAKLIIPLTAIAFEAVHADVMGTLYGLDQFVSVKARSGQLGDYAKAFEDYVNYDLENNVKFKDRTESSIIEIEKYGTGFGKARYEELTRYGVLTKDGVESDFPVVYRRGATVDTVPIARFMMPFSALHPQEAPWCGESHVDNANSIRIREDSGFFYPGTYDKLKAYYQAQGSETDSFERNQEDLENTRPVLPEKIEYFELWLAYPVDGDEEAPKEICVYYHFDAQEFMAIRYNDYSNLRRPYRFGRYIRVENRFYGLGIAKQNEQFQAEITVQHRQRIDNATIANIRMFKVQKLSGYGPKEPIFPGKMWFLDNLNDIEAFQAGEIYPSAYNNEQQSLIYSQQRTGVNELTLGMPAAGTPDTATSNMSRVQESKKKFDYCMNNIKTYLNDLVIDIYDVQQQYGPSHIQYYDVVDGGDMVKQVLAMPDTYIRDALMFRIKLVGELTNEIIDRQSWTQVMGMLQQYYSGMIEIATQTQNQQLLQIMSQAAVKAGTESMKQILESFNIKNIDAILPMVLLSPEGQIMLQPQQAQNPNAQQPINGSGNNGVAGPNQTGSMGPPNTSITTAARGVPNQSVPV